MNRDSLPPPSQRPPRILLVTADRNRRKRLTQLLRFEGHEVLTLDDPGWVLEHVRAHAPDLILLDVELPNTSGFDICTALRSMDESRVTPIVLMATQRTDELSVVHGLGVGADDYVANPSRLAELKARVEVQLRNRRDRELLQWARAQRAHLQRAALIDPLTGVSNRRAGDEELDDAVDVGTPIVLLMLDIDHFKSVNDTYGHQAGDVVLRHVGRTLNRLARQGDMVARVGGEEFMVIVRQAHPDIAPRIGERFRRGIESIELPGSAGIPRVTVSVGVATWDGTGDDRPSREELVEAADGALYEAKRGGRNRVCLRALETSIVDHTRQLTQIPPSAAES